MREVDDIIFFFLTEYIILLLTLCRGLGMMLNLTLSKLTLLLVLADLLSLAFAPVSALGLLGPSSPAGSSTFMALASSALLAAEM